MVMSDVSQCCDTALNRRLAVVRVPRETKRLLGALKLRLILRSTVRKPFSYKRPKLF